MKNNLLPEYSVEFEYKNQSKSYFQILFSKAVLDLNWKINAMNNDIIKVGTSLSLTSWGEEIEILLEEEKVIITSKCIGGQIMDWGKNKENVELLLSKIEALKKEIQINGNEESISSISENEINVQKKKKSLKDYFLFLIPTKKFLVTPILILLNIGYFITMAFDGTNVFNPQSEKLLFWGANIRELTLGDEWWRLFTCMFIHIGIVHLLMNLYALVFIGTLLEPKVGKLRFLIAYLVTGFFSSAVSLYWNNFAVSAGASGAIFGLFGVFLALLTTTIIEKSVRKPMLIYILIYVVINLVNGLQDGIDAAAHIGGLLSGICIGYVFYYGLINEDKKELNNWLMGGVALTVVIASFAIIETIPNPLKQYSIKNNQNTTLKYFELYNEKMEEFEANESIALDAFIYADDDKEIFLYQLREKSLFHWQDNLKIVREIKQYSLPKEVLDKNNLLEKYTILRIKQNDLIYNSINLDTDKYNKEILENQQEIDNILYSTK